MIATPILPTSSETTGDLMMFSSNQEKSGLAEDYQRAIDAYDKRLHSFKCTVQNAFNKFHEADNNINQRYWLTKLEEGIRSVRRCLESRDQTIDQLFKEYKDKNSD